VVLPSFVFTSLAFLSFFVPEDDLADKLSLTFTLMLTAAAYKIVSSSATPDVPFLTMLDTYVVACLTFTVLIAVQIVIVSQLHTLYDSLNLISGLTCAGLWVLYNVCTLIRWIYVRKSLFAQAAVKSLLQDGSMPLASPNQESISLLSFTQKLSAEGATNLDVDPIRVPAPIALSVKEGSV
jgi:hypothetical protein